MAALIASTVWGTVDTSKQESKRFPVVKHSKESKAVACNTRKENHLPNPAHTGGSPTIRV
jgi:hypothetical protein